MNDERTAPDATLPRPISMPGAGVAGMAGAAAPAAPAAPAGEADAGATEATAAGPLHVVALPVMALELAHVAEAKRALIAQGHGNVDDDGVVRLLWAARCLPVALDVLADASSVATVTLTNASFRDVDVELGVPPTERRSLLAVGYAVAGGVIVEVVEKRALLLARDDDAPPCCVVRFAVIERGEEDQAGGSDSGVPVTRFTVGSPAR